MNYIDILTSPTVNKLKDGELVDRIGFLKAQIAPMEALLDVAVDELKSRGRGTFVGTLYDATVFDQSNDRLDMQAVRAKLSRQFILANTTPGTKTVCKVTAKQLAVAA